MTAFSLHPLSAAAAFSCFPGSRRLQNTGIITANRTGPAGRGSSAAGGTPGRQPRSVRRRLRDGRHPRICPAPPWEPQARESPRARGGAQRRRGSLGTVHARLGGRPCPKVLPAFAANTEGEAAGSSRHLGQARLFCFYPMIFFFIFFPTFCAAGLSAACSTSSRVGTEPGQREAVRSCPIAVFRAAQRGSGSPLCGCIAFAALMALTACPCHSAEQAGLLAQA